MKWMKHAMNFNRQKSIISMRHAVSFSGEKQQRHHKPLRRACRTTTNQLILAWIGDAWMCREALPKYIRRQIPACNIEDKNLRLYLQSHSNDQKDGHHLHILSTNYNIQMTAHALYKSNKINQFSNKECHKNNCPCPNKKITNMSQLIFSQ